ncbi:hypothetical protein DMUE_3553 [Dictyocoela muelleri]|nr:hypothetical protein DMUE_3553 [Dictyocoela muelleri]
MHKLKITINNTYKIMINIKQPATILLLRGLITSEYQKLIKTRKIISIITNTDGFILNDEDFVEKNNFFAYTDITKYKKYIKKENHQKFKSKSDKCGHEIKKINQKRHKDKSGGTDKIDQDKIKNKKDQNLNKKTEITNKKNKEVKDKIKQKIIHKKNSKDKLKTIIDKKYRIGDLNNEISMILNRYIDNKSNDNKSNETNLSLITVDKEPITQEFIPLEIDRESSIDKKNTSYENLNKFDVSIEKDISIDYKNSDDDFKNSNSENSLIKRNSRLDEHIQKKHERVDCNVINKKSPKKEEESGVINFNEIKDKENDFNQKLEINDFNQKLEINDFNQKLEINDFKSENKENQKVLNLKEYNNIELKTRKIKEMIPLRHKKMKFDISLDDL